ncbi:hypothetical protein LQ567_16530 [Niabella pedocola]|uniref:Deacetylase sirtuin-type domain-containing protein n=1 Tax=Niabella pedocola TaxID=1752077 RepID=A0ABS8PVS3_9BACT|nr:hypothetical protein [Niabella pedocola]MCD2424388.1 hypothetical protein [Niabella pedocola]
MSVIPPRNAPHVVILGAGASLAAFPNGDKNGRKLPLMNSLVDMLELKSILPKKYSPYFNDFEKLYGIINADLKQQKLKEQIDRAVYNYFYDLQVPETPTLYDYLLLSLTNKDIIATFNWDPLLLQCMRRHPDVKSLPRVHFLHGNVAVGICYNCTLLGYMYNHRCHRCNDPFQPMRLLYPVEKKDYNSDPAIKNEWNELKKYIQQALYVTVFGYSAPASDVEAKQLMIDAILNNRYREFYEVDIIDIKVEDELYSNWKKFLYKQHYGFISNFQESYLWQHPRRSTEAFFDAYLMNSPWEDNPFPSFSNISDMHKWIEPLTNVET